MNSKTGTKKISLVFLLAGLALFLGACDFSTFLGGVKNEEKVKILAMTHFSVDASKNAELADTYTGTIDAEKQTVTISLPYSIINDNTPLIPTIKANYSIKPDPSGKVGFKDDFEIRISSNAQSKVYTVKSSVDPSTITYLGVTQPFFLNTSMEKEPLDTAAVVLGGNSIRVKVDSDTFAAVKDRPIGFEKLLPPSGTTFNLANAVYGKVAPYTVDVTSKDGKYTSEYSVSLASGDSTNTGITALYAKVQNVYSRTIEKVTDQSVSDFNNWLSAKSFSWGSNKYFWPKSFNWKYMTENSGWSGNNTHIWELPIVIDWNDPFKNGYDLDTYFDIEIRSGTNYWYDWYGKRATNQYRFSQTSSYKGQDSCEFIKQYLITQTSTVPYLTEPKTISLSSTNFPNTFTYPDIPTVVDPISHGVQVTVEAERRSKWRKEYRRADPDTMMGGTYAINIPTKTTKWPYIESAQSWQWRGWKHKQTDSQQYTISGETTTTYVAQEGYKIHSITAQVPFGTTIDNVTKFSGCESVDVDNESGTVTFNIVDSGKNVTPSSSIGYFNVNAQNGDSETHVIVLE